MIRHDVTNILVVNIVRRNGQKAMVYNGKLATVSVWQAGYHYCTFELNIHATGIVFEKWRGFAYDQPHFVEIYIPIGTAYRWVSAKCKKDVTPVY